MHSPAQPAHAADDATVFLQLTRLLNDVERHHPEVSAPLRLTLLRAHRDHEISWLDQTRFRAVLHDLVDTSARA